MPELVERKEEWDQEVMSALDREVNAVQNPALGAVVLWRFACGYQFASQLGEPAPLPVIFLVLPVLFDEDMSEMVAGTQVRSGLRVFVAKFSEARTSKGDVVFSLENRSRIFRQLTADSLRIAVGSGLVSVDPSRAGIFPTSTTFPKAGIPETLRPLLRSSEKFGKWLGELTLYEIGLVLKVAF